MTSEIRSSVKKPKSRGYFRFLLENNWQFFLLFMLFSVVAMIIPTFIGVGMIAQKTDYTPVYTRNDYYCELASTISVIGVFLGGLYALISGMFALSYVNKVKSVGCFHSLPVRREAVYFGESGTFALFSLVSLLFGFLVSSAVLSVKAPNFADCRADYYTLLFAAVVLYLLVFSVLLFVGGFAGRNGMKLFLAAYYFGIVFVLYCALLAVFCFVRELDWEFYVSDGVANVLFTPYRYVTGVLTATETKTFTRLFVCLGEAVVCYIGGLLLHKYRKSEGAGKSIIWKIPFEVVKYSVIFLSSLGGLLLFGYAFTLISDDHSGLALRLFFGGLFFGFLAYILVNMLLYRSTKAIFKDFKGFVIYSVALVLFIVLIPLNVTGLVARQYSYENTSRLDVKLSLSTETPLTVKDPDAVMAILDYKEDEENDYTDYFPQHFTLKNEEDEALVDNFFSKEYFEVADENGNTISEPCYFIPFYISTESYLGLRQYPKFGIPYAISEYMPTETLTSILADTDEFVDYINKNALEALKVSDYASLEENNYQCNWFSMDDTLAAELAACIEKNPYTLEKKANGTLLGELNIEINNGFVVYPVYDCDTELLQLIDRAADEFVEDSNVAYDGYTQAVREDFYSSLSYSKGEKTDKLLFVLVNSESGEGVVLENGNDIFDKTIGCYASTSAFFTDFADTPYSLVVANGNDAFVLPFREGDVTDAELDAIFYAK